MSKVVQRILDVVELEREEETVKTQEDGQVIDLMLEERASAAIRDLSSASVDTQMLIFNIITLKHHVKLEFLCHRTKRTKC